MSAVPDWRLEGDWMDVCSCAIPCPCSWAQKATNDFCEGLLAYHVRQGSYGDVSLDGLNVMAVVDFEGGLWDEGQKINAGLFIDDRADARQQEALQMIFGGQAGGWPANVAALIGDLRGVEVAPMTVEVDEDLGHWRAEVPGKIRASSTALSGPTSVPGGRVQSRELPGAEVGPMGDAVCTWGSSDVHEIDCFGFKQSHTGRSSKTIPFSWTGPS